MPTSSEIFSELQNGSVVNTEKTEPITRVHRMPFGAEVNLDGSVRFTLFAPAVEEMSLAIEGLNHLAPMTRTRDGWHRLESKEAGIGSLYSFVLPDGTKVPDPASRFQPYDIGGPSEVIASGSYLWRDSEWRGRPWEETVLYELHVGTFTPEGTFQAAIGRLDSLAELGVTAIEIMPVADFPGRWNWGYDGVLLFAPDSSYGRPEDMKAFIEQAHNRGISVILDVVYNHFGPEGNFVRDYFPQIFTQHHKTAWGDAINYDGEGSTQVREFIVHNALYWIEEFHLDGLRFDAVHAIVDTTTRHILQEIAETVRTAITGRPLHLILENEKNEARYLLRNREGEAPLFTAQWNDDIHHVLHTAATHESHGYYSDYQGRIDLLGKALAEGFAYQGQVSACKGEPKGEPSHHLPPTAFVAFAQNHDQVGNRAYGERLGHLVDSHQKRAIVATLLLSPQIPLLFMGEEWNAPQPFLFFCDFGEELGSKVRDGRRNEFSAFPEFADQEKRSKIPDPQAEATFLTAKLSSEDADSREGKDWRAFYRALLAKRRERILPLLHHITGDSGSYEVLGGQAVRVRWKLSDGGVLEYLANLSQYGMPLEVPTGGEELWHEGPPVQEGKLGPWTVRWSYHQI